MILVADASVVVAAVTPDSRKPVSQRALATADLVHAPELIVAEVANAGWRLYRAGRIVAEHQDSMSTDLADLIQVFHPLRPLASRAAEIARQLDHPVYDCFYLALAERLGCAVATLDTRLVARLDGTPFAGRAALPEALAED